MEQLGPDGTSGSEHRVGSDIHEDENEDIDSQEEELEDLPSAEKEADPLRNAKIMRVIDGKEHTTHVEDIEVGKLTGERVYRLKYSDGDMQQMTEHQAREHQVTYEKDQARRAIGAFCLDGAESGTGGNCSDG